MHTTKDHVIFWIGLSGIPGVGRATFRKLVRQFGSPERALSATRNELETIEGLASKSIDAIVDGAWGEHAARERDRARESGVAIVTVDDPDFPPALRDTPDPPLFLYIRGTIAPGDAEAVAVVGTRRPTLYGKTVAHRLAHDLATAGLTVISGMARGIDTQAHRGAVSAQGRTIAVLGCGIDVAYPPENRSLMEHIGRTGAVVTENPLGTKPEAGYFPARNRIISGLSLGTVIVEASEDSGSLITAEYAVGQGRRLFAIPGNIGSPQSRGANSLIKGGAVLIENAADVLAVLGIRGGGSPRTAIDRPLPPLSPDEAAVLEHLSDEPRHIDSILAGNSMAAGALSGVLITLELKGLAKQLPGKYFIKQD